MLTDVNTQEVMLRKVITIQDLTLCLDKMDASGKIEIYQVFILRYILYIYLFFQCVKEKNIVKRSRKKLI